MSEHFASEIGPRRRPAIWFDWKPMIEHQPDYHEVLETNLRNYGDARDADAVNRIHNAALRHFMHAAFTLDTANKIDELLRRKCASLPSEGSVQTDADKALMMPLVNIADLLEEAIAEANGATKREPPRADSTATPAGATTTLAEQTDPVTRAIALMLAADREGKPIKKTDLPNIVGCSRSTLYRDPQFKATCKAMKAKKRANVPKGSKSKEGIEAGYDPNEE